MAIEIKGLESLMRKLDSMGGNVLDALSNSVKVTTEKAKGDAKANIHNRSGDLGRSVDFNSGVESTDTSVTGTVAANTKYALYVEMGTVNAPAYPYMMPALNANRDTFKRLSENELLKAIRKAGG